MTKVIVTADLHLSDTPRDQYRMKFMDELVTIAERRKPDAIVILGDLTEQKDRHPARFVNPVCDKIHALAQVAPTAILEGNHDYSEMEHPFFEFLQRIPNVHWISKISEAAALPKQFRAPLAGCLFLPHTKNPERDWKGWVDRDKWGKVFTHQLYTGADIGSFGVHGVGTDMKIVPKNVQVLSGDVHKPQRLGDNIEYVGAPYRIDFGDDYKPRIIEMQGMTTRSISVDAFPQKRLIEVDGIAELLKLKSGYHEGDILKIRIRVADLADWVKIHKQALEWATACQCTADRIEPIADRVAMRTRVMVTDDVMAPSDEKVLRAFARRHNIDPKIEAVGLALLEDKDKSDAT